MKQAMRGYVLIVALQACGCTQSSPPDRPLVMQKASDAKPVSKVVRNAGPVAVVEVDCIRGETVKFDASFPSPWAEQKAFKSVQGVCSCTDVKFSPLSVVPGKKVNISGSVDTRKSPGPNISFVGEMEDGQLQELPFVVRVVDKPVLVVDKWGADFGDIPAQTSIARAIPLRSEVPLDPNGVYFERVPDSLAIELADGGPSGSSYLYDIKVTRSPDNEERRIRDQFTLVIPRMLGRDRRFSFEVTGRQLPSSVQIVPTRGFLGVVTTQKDSVTTFKVRSWQSLSINSIEAPSWLVTTFDVKAGVSDGVELIVKSRLNPEVQGPNAGIVDFQLAATLDGKPCRLTIPMMYTAVWSGSLSE